MNRYRSQIFGAILVALIWISGCNPPPDPTLDLMDSQLSELKIDDLAKTMEFVFSEERFETSQFEEKVSTGLNRWATIHGDELQVPWELDPMVSDLVQQYESLPVVQRTSEISFVNTDAHYLQEAAWIEMLSARLRASRYMKGFEFYRLAAEQNQWSDDPDTDPLADVLNKLNPELSSEQVTQMSSAIRLFDWLTRNIQLLPDPDMSPESIAEQRLFADAADLPSAGVRGVGYGRYPWQVMLHSRGDYVERGKLFMRMMEHLGIDCLMLHVRDQSDADQWQPWCVALAIGDRYYLFDPKLGLPIPGERPGSVATLAQVRDNPELLTSLDLTIDESLRDDTKYWVRPEQVSELRGAIYVSPESIAKRFRQVEGNLVGDQRLKLTVNPSEIANRLPKPPGLEIAVWDIGFKTHAFRQAVREAIKQASFDDVLREKLRWYYLEESYIDDFALYRTARTRYFKGVFETVRNDRKADAFELFYILMYDDKTIASLGTDRVLQNQLGIFSEQMSLQEMQMRIQSVQGHMRLVRRDAGYFLAQCHFDNDNMGTCINWLTRLQRQSMAYERWRDGIEYLLARGYEGRKEYDQSIQTLGNDELVQFHGNLIRARMLKQVAPVRSKP